MKRGSVQLDRALFHTSRMETNAAPHPSIVSRPSYSENNRQAGCAIMDSSSGPNAAHSAIFEKDTKMPFAIGAAIDYYDHNDNVKRGTIIGVESAYWQEPICVLDEQGFGLWIDHADVKVD